MPEEEIETPEGNNDIFHGTATLNEYTETIEKELKQLEEAAGIGANHDVLAALTYQLTYLRGTKTLISHLMHYMKEIDCGPGVKFHLIQIAMATMKMQHDMATKINEEVGKIEKEALPQE